MKSFGLQFVKDTLLELDPSVRDESDETYKTAVVLLSAIVRGTEAIDLATFTGVPIEFVARIRQRMIRAELWTDLEADCDHWEVAPGVVSMTTFWTDVLVGEGLVVRQWDEEIGQYRYCAASHAPQKDELTDKVN